MSTRFALVLALVMHPLFVGAQVNNTRSGAIDIDLYARADCPGDTFRPG